MIIGIINIIIMVIIINATIATPPTTTTTIAVYSHEHSIGLWISGCFDRINTAGLKFKQIMNKKKAIGGVRGRR